MQIKSYFFLLSLVAVTGAYGEQERSVRYNEKSSTKVGGARVNVNETITTDSTKLLKDFLNEHPPEKRDGDPKTLGRTDNVTLIVPAEGNTNTTVNVNLFVTMERRYLQLTREQKRSLQLVDVIDDPEFIERERKDGVLYVKFKVRGIRIGENMFVRVTKNRDYTFSDDDEYYHIASRSSLTSGARSVNKVDPHHLNVEPGSDQELEHYGVVPPRPADYLTYKTLKVNFPACYPASIEKNKVEIQELDKRNAHRWNQFGNELQEKRDQLGVGKDSQVLKWELFLRYHPSNLAQREDTKPPHELCDGAYLNFEWGMDGANYKTLPTLGWAPSDYPVGYSSFAQKLQTDLNAAHQSNLEKWNTFQKQAAEKQMPQDCWNVCYWKWIYDGSRYNTTWTKRGVTFRDIDANPPHRSVAERSKYGITLPRFRDQALLYGVPPHAQNVVPFNVYGQVVKAPDLERMNDFNRAVQRHNRREWNRFLDELSSAGIPKSAYVGQWVSSVYLNDPDVTDYHQLGRWFYFYAETKQKLPDVDGDSFPVR